MFRYKTALGGSSTGAGGMARYLDGERLPEMPDQRQALYYQQEKNPTDDLRPHPPETRQDMHPSVASTLGLDASRTPTTDEIAHLFEGNRTDGTDLPNEHGHTKKITYVDMVFSADKSVSVAYALAPTEAERQVIYRTHVEAADLAMAYVSGELGRKRLGHGGANGHEDGHISWVRFDHYTARPVLMRERTDVNGVRYTDPTLLSGTADPQIHSHYAVPNVVVTESGRVGSLDLQQLEGRVKEFGAYYQALLATGLRRSGIDAVFDPETGAARIASIPQHVRDSFSKRRMNATDSVREIAKEAGVDWDGLTEKGQSRFLEATFAKTKQRKDIGADHMENWRQQARDIGYSHRSVLRPDEIIPLPSLAQRQEIAFDAGMPLWSDDLKRRAVMTGADARVIAARSLIVSGVQAPEEINMLTKKFRDRGVMQDGVHTKLIWAQEARRRGPDRTSITTELHEAQETELVNLVKAANADRSRALAPAAIEQAVARSGLDFSSTEHGRQQRQVIERLGTGGRFEVAIGVAGSGKSTALRPLVDAWTREGKNVYGVALAWRQTEDLAGAGIERRAAMAKFLHPKFQEKNLIDHNSVVAVDEIGQTGTRQMLELLRLQKERGFAIVALGDPKQCQSIDAGPVITLMERALGEEAIPAILSSIRQQTERDRAATLLFREGKAEEALAIKRDDGTAQLVAGDYSRAIERVASLWQERMTLHKADAEFSLSISAPTNKEARDIGAAIREHRRTMGEVGPDRVTLKAADQTGQTYDLPLAVGDKVRLFNKPPATFTDGHGGVIGTNGKVVQIRGIEGDRLLMRMDSGREGWVKIADLVKADSTTGRFAYNETRRPMLTYGDALTIDATQGITSTEHINALPSGTRAVNGFKAYVAESRHRLRTWMVVGEGAERAEIHERRSLNDRTPILEKDVWKNMARNLERQPEKDSALAFLTRAHSVRRSRAVSLPRAAQPGEDRARRGLPPMTIGRRLARSRAALAISRTVHQVDGFARQRSLAYRRTVEIGHAIERGVQRLRPDRPDGPKITIPH